MKPFHLPEESRSPRIELLARELEGGRLAALDEFWQSIAAKGTPLIESTDAPDEVLVTFVWRDTEKNARSVRVVGGPAGWYWSTTPPLTRLPGSDLWHATLRVRSDFRGNYRLLVDHDVSFDDPDLAPLPELDAAWAAAVPDPLNPNRLIYPPHEADPESRQPQFSVLELPGAPAQEWLAQRGASAGKLQEFRLHSTELHNERRVWIYSPPAPARMSDAGLVILLDGWMWSTVVPFAVALDNMFAAGKTPPLVVAMVDSIGGETRWSELACNPVFANFLVNEGLSLVRERTGLEPEVDRTIVAGQSLGGLAAAFAATQFPAIFGNVLSQAGAFYWSMSNHRFAGVANMSEIDPGDGVMMRHFADASRLPLRFYIEVGTLENRIMLESNRRFRDLLDLKGYDLDYREFNGAHDYVCWRGSLCDGLISLTSRW